MFEAIPFLSFSFHKNEFMCSDWWWQVYQFSAEKLGPSSFMCSLGVAKTPYEAVTWFKNIVKSNNKQDPEDLGMVRLQHLYRAIGQASQKR